MARYLTLNQYFRRKYGRRVQRVPVDGGFNCPNRDGTKAWGGCRFCNNAGFSPTVRIPLEDQIQRGIERAAARTGAGLFMLYFQPYSNTYGPVSVLRSIYDVIETDPRFVALAVGTRADCLHAGVIELLESYTDRYEVWLELGLQTVHDRTLDRMNRQEHVEGYRRWIEHLGPSPVKVCLHLLMGLPGEDLTMMRQTIQTVRNWPIDGIKCHNLHILRGTDLGRRFEREPWPLMSMSDYVQLLADLIEVMPKHVVLHRLVADSPRDLVLGPEWAGAKSKVLLELDRVLQEREVARHRGLAYELNDSGNRGTIGRD